MKNRPKLLPSVLLLLGFLVLSLVAPAQSINIEAAAKYWEITDALRQNKPLTDEVWADFLQLQGNKVYVKGVFDSASLRRYRKAIEVVYMPLHDSLLQAQLKKKVWYYVLVNDYKTNEDLHRKYMRETSQNPRYLGLMYQLAYEYLPQKAHTQVQDLKLYYNALGNDAASRSEGIFFSLHSAVNWNKPKEGILEAHEIHHQIRPRKDFGEVEEADKGLLWALASIQNEGTADLIDKKAIYQAGGQDSVDMHEWLLAQAPSTIQKLDSTIQVLAKGGEQTNPPIQFYSKLMNGSGGHMPGFHVALVLENNGYRKEMIETIDDPFAFLRLYQKAARKDKAHPPVFSKTSMAYLKKLEQKYTAAKAVKGALPAK